MDFRIPQELSDLRASFATFLDREVRPIEESIKAKLWDPAADREQLYDAGHQVVLRSAAAGFYAAHMPDEVGGSGLSVLGTTLLVEDAARCGMRLGTFAVAPPNPSGPTPLLLELPEHLWDVYVRPVVRGEKTMCFALTEPEAGSDAQSIRTRAERDGDEWIITGHKHYITNADRADFAVVFAVTDPEKRAAGGVTAFLVPSDRYDVGKKQYTIGDSHPCEVLLDGARVPADHVLGEVGQGFFSAMRFLNAGRAYIGAHCLGLAEYCLEEAVAHAGSRTAFGRPLGKFQGVSFPLAESKAEIEGMRWLAYHLAWLVDEGEQPILDSSIVKYYATERAYVVADRCLQVFGGMGLLREGPIEAILRQLRVMRIVEGASGIQQLVISRALGM
ncbi:MAG: acyl-CoA dehydrogenase family protein [Streptosporangiaceae bacterium]